MNYYVIGIGGTGAKCIEALTHLCASGLMPDGDLYVLFVDPDTANGNLERARNTLDRYSTCRKLLNLRQCDLLKTNIVSANPDVWSPFEDKMNPTLELFFGYDELKADKKNKNYSAAAHLFDVLYSRAEKEVLLDKGFRGHPSIGAAILAETVKLGEGDPWQAFRKKINQDIKEGTGARIFLFGSIFGGTGASGFPTIARLIRKEIEDEYKSIKSGEKTSGPENIKIGGGLILPYFSFTFDRNDDELKALSEDFLINTKASLRYYHQSKVVDYDAIYLIGDKSSPVSKASLGGNTQRNEPHFIELYAALSAIEFFSNNDSKGYYMIAKDKPNLIQWGDLPEPHNKEIDNLTKGEKEKLKDQRLVRKKMGQLTRFAFSFNSTYYPMLEDIRKNGKGYRAPWYVDLFEREGVSISDNNKDTLDYIKNYCEDFLIWVANINLSSTTNKIDLVQCDAFAEKDNDSKEVNLLETFRLNYFDNLFYPLEKKNKNDLGNLWEKTCNAGTRNYESIGLGKFIQVLFNECLD